MGEGEGLAERECYLIILVKFKGREWWERRRERERRGAERERER